MRSRRSFCAACATAIPATVPLAGCTATGPPGVPVSFARAPLGPPPEGVPTVARGVSRAVVDDGCPKGFTTVDATVTRHPVDDVDRVELRCRTDHRVIPGGNVCASRGWRVDGVGVAHDWGALPDGIVVGANSDAVPAEGASVATLERDATGSLATWRVHLTDEGDDTWTFAFVSRVRLAGSPAAGTDLVTVGSETHVRDGPFESDVVGVETTLAYADGTDRDGSDARTRGRRRV